MYDVHVVLLAGAVTALLRYLPFIAFGRTRPEFVMYLGRVLPPAVMAMLVVYCLRGADVLGGAHGIPEVLSCLAVVVLHVWRRSTLLSISVGTVLYMFLIQVVFT